MPTACKSFLLPLDTIRHVSPISVLLPAYLFWFTVLFDLVDATLYDLNEYKVACLALAIKWGYFPYETRLQKSS